MLLTELERQEIVKMIKEYKSARKKLADNYKSRRARTIVNSVNKRVERYFDMMNYKSDEITSDDVKYFALIVDVFEPMRRNSLLKELQKHADFDVSLYVENYNNGLIKRISNSVKNDLNDLSPKQMNKICVKYKTARANLKKGRNIQKNTEFIEQCRLGAYAYARAIINGNVSIDSIDVNSAYAYLTQICPSCVDGDEMESAQNLLAQKIQENKENNINAEELKRQQEQEHIQQKRQQEQERAQQKQQQKQLRKQERQQNRQIFFGGIRQKFKDFINNARTTFANDTTVEHADFEPLYEQADVIETNQRMVENHTQNTEPVVEEKQRKEKTKIHRSIFTRVAAVAAVAAVITAGVAMFKSDSNKNTKSQPEPIKKEVKHTPVMQKQTINQTNNETIAPLDTAYARALKNYYNSALDIIAGNKKSDVLNKIENQVKSGNVALSDSITVERIAYAYFIYREYGFNIDVLNLAVNGNQQLTKSQQQELIQVIKDAGERGTGVQKMAKQRVESRGGQLSSHSKFKNASKQQQRQHLVNLGLLKKAHVR